MEQRLRVVMFGPALSATSGISAVVNKWLAAGLGERVEVRYLSTLDVYAPGRYLAKALEAMRAYVQLARLRPGELDLVHLHVSSGMSFYRKLGVFVLTRLKRLKAVVHLHGSTFREFYEQGGRVRQALIRWMFRRAERVIVLSEYWKGLVGEWAGDEGHIEVVHNAALPSTKRGTGGAGEIVIACMGRLGQRKGTYDLLEVFRRLAGERQDVRLVLGGDGEVERVRSMVREQGLEGRVEVPGWLEGEAKEAVFERADVYALPSYNEGLPGSLLEAMAAGTPVITTPVGGIPELVEDGLNGYLVQPGDIDSLHGRLSRLCEDTGLRAAMGAAARARVEEAFDVRKAVGDLLALYRGLHERGNVNRLSA